LAATGCRCISVWAVLPRTKAEPSLAALLSIAPDQTTPNRPSLSKGSFPTFDLAAVALSRALDTSVITEGLTTTSAYRDLGTEGVELRAWPCIEKGEGLLDFEALPGSGRTIAALPSQPHDHLDTDHAT